MQFSNNRLIMDLPSASKMIWSTTTSPTLFLAFKNLFKLSMYDTGNEKKKFPKIPHFRVIQKQVRIQAQCLQVRQQVWQEFFNKAEEQLQLHTGQHFRTKGTHFRPLEQAWQRQ